MKRRCFPVLFLSVLALFLPASASAYAEYISCPDHVDVGEEIHVWVEGWMPNLCWVYEGWQINIYSNKLVVYIDTYMEATDGGCPTAVKRYEVSATIPGQEEGVYILRVYENRPPLEPYFVDFELTVGAVVEAEPTSWDALKALYR